MDSCLNNLIQMQITALIYITVTAEAILSQDKLHLAVLLHNVAAGAADSTFKGELNAIPVLLSAENQAAVAVGTKAKIRVAQPDRKSVV